MLRGFFYKMFRCLWSLVTISHFNACLLLSYVRLHLNEKTKSFPGHMGPGANLIWKISSWVILPLWNEVLRLNVASIAMTFTQSECIISEQSNYSTLKFRYKIGSRNPCNKSKPSSIENVNVKLYLVLPLGDHGCTIWKNEKLLKKEQRLLHLWALGNAHSLAE